MLFPIYRNHYKYFNKVMRQVRTRAVIDKLVNKRFKELRVE
jgi:hypothetical protein